MKLEKRTIFFNRFCRRRTRNIAKEKFGNLMAISAKVPIALTCQFDKNKSCQMRVVRIHPRRQEQVVFERTVPAARTSEF